MKEPTYSVHVRFRRGQRLTLKRAAPLDVALRFVSELRSERFHNPDDVFIVDDTSGDTISEASITPDGVVQTLQLVQKSAHDPEEPVLKAACALACNELRRISALPAPPGDLLDRWRSLTTRLEAASALRPPPPSQEASSRASVLESTSREKGELETLLTYVGRWQLRHAQLTLKGGQRLTSTVERSLGQLIRLMEYMQRMKLLDRDVAQILADTAQALEQVRKVRETLQQAEVKLQDTPPSEVTGAENAASADTSVPTPRSLQPQTRKKQARGKE